MAHCGGRGFCRGQTCVSLRVTMKNKQKPNQRVPLKSTLDKYGIDELDYILIMQEQQDRCAICRVYEEGTGKKGFHIDHCHKTGRVRGVLCPQCNLGLGQFADNPRRLLSAIKYLMKYRG